MHKGELIGKNVPEHFSKSGYLCATRMREYTKT
jgi:hypothetical protein